MPNHLEVLFAPAEFTILLRRDLSRTVCVVFDILRATTTMTMALSNGAREIVPVGEIDEALAIRQNRPDVLLAGERNGLRIRAEQARGVDFDLGNSPREFVREIVNGRTIVMTTTNGTRAIRACATARKTVLGSFLGMAALARWIESEKPSDLLLVCSGTVEQASLEDGLAAGALCELIWPIYSAGAIADSAEMARRIYQSSNGDLLGTLNLARNGRRLLAHPELSEDVAVCVARDTIDFIAAVGDDGVVRKLS